LLTYIQHRLQEWEHLGVKTAADGSRLIAHTPRDGYQRDEDASTKFAAAGSVGAP